MERKALLGERVKNMNPQELVKERYYFLLTFYDKKATIPKISTVIFIGKNILTEKKYSKRDEWYFQDVESYLEHGPFIDMAEGTERDVFALEKKDLSSLYDSEVLITTLRKILF